MNKYRVLIILLLTVCLVSSVRQAKAYGNSIITVNCPVITVSATSDKPLTYAGVGRNYIVAWFQNYATGRTQLFTLIPTSSELVVTAVGSTYVRYHYSYSLDRGSGSKYLLSVGDRFSFYMQDETGYLGKIEGTCAGSTITSNSTPPSGYRPMTIMCLATILSSPAGPVLPLTPGITSERIPEVGKQRYVLLVGAVGSDGQLYDKIQADAVTFGYFPHRCLGE